MEQTPNSIIDNNITLIQNRVEQLEKENARLAATATTTTPKEDPPMQNNSPAGNRAAYIEDIKNFF